MAKKYPYMILAFLISFAACAFAAAADESSQSGGEVKISLQAFNAMSEAAKGATGKGAAFAAGNATAVVNVDQSESSATLEVESSIEIKLFEDGWTRIPLLPSGAALVWAKADGAETQLVETAEGLAWPVKQAGSYKLELRYIVDAARYEGGYAAAIPLPPASSTSFHATLPGSHVEAALIPSADFYSESGASSTAIRATVPRGSGAQLSWKLPAPRSFAVNRATYRGKLRGESILWSGELQVETFADKRVEIALLPRKVTFSDLKADGKEASIFLDEGKFVTQVNGRGPHKLTFDFETPVQTGEGAPRAELPLLEVPITKLELSLPGNKDLQIEPAASVDRQQSGEETIASAFLPMSESASLSWTDAVPDPGQTELRADASIFQSAFAAEGLLEVRAVIDYDISRGETSRLELGVPAGVDIEKVSSESGAIADWRLISAGQGKVDTMEVFLDRAVSGPFRFEVQFDRPLDGQEAAVPLLRAASVRRQRGMIALLSSKESALQPVEETGFTRIGENQIPADLRQKLEMTVAHTFKYPEAPPPLQVRLAEPEKKPGRFDAQINTLISLGDVSLRGSATVEIRVKSGSIASLALEVPAKINLLSLTAPSLRASNSREEGGKQIIDVEFTQEMEGEFRIEAAYEYLIASEGQVVVPTLLARGAEVEQGKIALEALSALEVQPASASNLSSLNPNELPQQLILKTSNPILLAYGYVKVDPPYELALKMTRHKEIPTQTASIDEARYSTLFTRDGLAVTTADFSVRNTQNQFLRLKLPRGSKVWSAYVNGAAEKPAVAESGQDADSGEVLVKIISSAQAFPVRLTFESPAAPLKSFGLLRASLPKPDMIVTKSLWDVYLPDDIVYLEPRGNLELLSSGLAGSLGAIPQVPAAGAPAGIDTTAKTMRYSFQKLYATQSAGESYIAIPFGTKAAKYGCHALVALASVLMLAGILGASGAYAPLAGWRGRVAALAGAAFLGLAYYLGLSLMAALLAWVLSALAWTIRQGQHVRQTAETTAL